MINKIFLWALKRVRPNSTVIFLMMDKLHLWGKMCDIETMWEVSKNGY